MKLANLRTKIALSTTLAISLLGVIELPAAAKATHLQVQQTSMMESRDGLVARRRRLRGFRYRARPSRYRLGGFSRSGACLAGRADAKMTAVVPPTRAEEIDAGTDDVAIDSTVSANPAFFAHVPEVPANSQAQFTLQDADGTQEFYTTSFTLDGKSGIVGVSLPATVALDIDTTYLWQMAVQCEGSDVQLVTSGWIQRVAMDGELTQQVSQATTPADKAAVFADAGIWQDSLAELAKLRLSNPNDATALNDWQTLMNSVDLPSLANEPVLKIEGN